MAIMCPELPKDFEPASKEDIIFDALSKLPDSYYVFHSVSLLVRRGQDIIEHEADFLVFHPNKGILCIEAKAGQVRYEDGAWRYANGDLMHNGGPFKQVSTFRHNLVDYIRGTDNNYLLRKCKIMGAVCFPSVSKARLSKDKLPCEADYELILFNESLREDEIEKAISHIFEQHYERTPDNTTLTKSEAKTLLESVLAPKLNLLPIATLEHEHRTVRFKSMLNEQTALLDYLEEQRTAVISGAAGTGKTLMAIEKAKRNAEKGERVLFLCYNKKLQEHLSKTYEYSLIDFYTIDGFACSICRTSKSDYDLLQEKLLELMSEGNFPYKHIVIDEGQDFGQDKMNDSEVIDLLYDIIYEDESESGSFYMFYDKNQLVQGSRLPKCIAKADCRLTLYRNCRNTENIAISSLRFLGSEKMPKVFEKSIKGNSPVMIIEQSEDAQIRALNKMLDEYSATYGGDIVILTCKTVENSLLSQYRDGDYYRYNGKKYLFTTCRRFKGLEADAVIIIDADSASISENDMKNILYVGTSRAKFELCLINGFSEEDMQKMLAERNIKKAKNIKAVFAALYNAKIRDFSAIGV